MENYLYQFQGFEPGDTVCVVREGKETVTGILSHITGGSAEKGDNYAQSHVIINIHTNENAMIESGPDAMTNYTFTAITEVCL